MVANATISYGAIKMDARLRELKYEHKVQKHDMADSYARKKMNYTPSGYMTVEEYNDLSKYTEQPVEIKPQTVKKSELKYVPEPSYKIVRYNDPPGSPELNITRDCVVHEFEREGNTELSRVQ